MNNFSINIKKKIDKNICVSSHVKNVLSKYRSEQDTDIVIVSEDESKRIPAHRGILIAANEYFCKMLTIDMAEKTKKEVIICDVSGDVLEMLIDYCYSGEVLVTNENVWDLLAAADMLQFTDVKTECAHFLETLLKENQIECLRFYACAIRYAFKDLADLAIEIAAGLFNVIIKTDTFLDISYDVLKLILDKNESIESKEECIFNAAWAWVNHDKVNRKKCIPNILSLVCLKDMNLDFLSTEIKPVCFLNNCHELVFDAVLSKAAPAINTTFPKNSYILLAIVSIHNNIILDYYSDGQNGFKRYKLVPIKFNPSDAAFLAFNRNLYIFGESFLKIDLKELITIDLADMITKRKNYSVAMLNGLIYAIGGLQDSNDLKTVECYNPYTNAWSFVGEMSIARNVAKTAVLSNHIYVIGGCADKEYIKSCEYYNPLEEKWTKIADLIEQRKNPNVCVLNDLIYVIGGDLSPSEYSNILVQIYNPMVDEWSKIFTVTAHTHLFTTAVFENEIAKISKMTGSDKEAVLEKFIVEENIWTQKISFQKNCDYFYAAPILTKFLSN